MVTLRAIIVHMQKFYVLSHKALMGFVWISSQTATISPYSINWLVFVTQAVCLLRGYLYNSSWNHSLKFVEFCRVLFWKGFWAFTVGKGTKFCLLCFVWLKVMPYLLGSSANKRLTVQPKRPPSYAVCVAWYKAQLETHSVTYSARHLARGTDIPIPLKITKPAPAKLPRMWLEFHPMCQM